MAVATVIRLVAASSRAACVMASRPGFSPDHRWSKPSSSISAAASRTTPIGYASKANVQIPALPRRLVARAREVGELRPEVTALEVSTDLSILFSRGCAPVNRPVNQA
jgi:hypothetical protein